MTTQTTNLLDENKVMDVRPIPCSIKHGLILRTWNELPVGDHFILLNDHDPVPLRYQFQAEFGTAFTREYLEKGPADFRVKSRRSRNQAPRGMPAPVDARRTESRTGVAPVSIRATSGLEFLGA